MTRHERREYLIACGFATIVALIAVVILKAGSGSGRANNSTELLSATVTESEAPEAGSALWPRRMSSASAVATRTSTLQPPLAESEPSPPSSAPPAASSEARSSFDATSAAPLASPANSSIRWPGELPSAAAIASVRSSGGRFAPAVGGGVGGGAAYPVAASPAPEATEPAEAVASDPTAQRARTEGGRLTSSTATTEESLAPPPDSPTSSSSAQVETASSARAPLSTALATAFEELAPWSLELAPVVLSSPEPFGEAAIEQIVSVESFAAPTNVESLVSNAVETLVQAQLALPGADVDLPVADASVADTRVLNPEPTTLMLLGTGLGLTARYARRRRAVGGVRL